MGIGEVRQGFDAFAAGRLSEAELRSSVRTSLQQEPQLISAYIALVAALGRGQVISATLQADILSDILAVTSAAAPQASERTVFRPAVEPLGPAMVHDARPVVFNEPIYADPDAEAAALRDGGGASAPTAATGSTTTGGATTGPTTGSTTGSAWDTPERLAEPAVPLMPGSRLKGRFELIEELGRGGMGVVYKALDRTTVESRDRNPYVAVKVLNEEFKRHPLAVRSLQREARKAQRLAHPNIVAVFDFDRDGGNVYMVMELLVGRSLDQVLRHDAPEGLPLERVREILAALGAALGYAHQHDIVHADFKPSNVFITEQGAVKVLDFGVARAVQTLNDKADRTLFDAGQLGAFSPPYASMEMLNGEKADPRDDIYALACVTYELLTGRHPFNRIDAVKACAAGVQAVAPGKLSRTQWQALKKALAFRRAERTETVQALVAAICEPARPRPWWALAAAALVLVVVAGVVGPRQWAAHQAAQLAQGLQTSDAPAFDAALARLHHAPAALRVRALSDADTRRSLIEHYRTAIAAAIAPPAYDFPRARGELADLQSLLPDSQVVVELSGRLQQRAQTILNELFIKRDAALGANVLVAAQGPDDLASILARIRRIDPAQSALADPRIAMAFLVGADRANAAGQLDLAESLLQAGLDYAPNDPRLIQAKSAADAAEQREANARRVADLEQRLGAISSASPDFLDEALARRDDLGALAGLAPNDAVLARLQASLQPVALDRLHHLLSQGDIAGARQLLLDLGELLPEQVAANANAAVLAAARVQDNHALDTIDRLRRAVLTGRITQPGNSGAMDFYASLQRSGASPDLLAQARDLLAYGDLHAARMALAGGDRTGAAAALAAARGLQPSALWQTRIQAEQALLEAQGAGGSKAAGAGSSVASAGQRDAVRQQFADTLQAATLGATELQALAAALDRLEALGASAEELDSGLRQVEDRVIAEITRQQQQSGVEVAEQYARQASQTLLTSERIADVARELRGTALGASQSFAPDVLAERDQLTALLARPEPTQHWASQLTSLLQKLAGPMSSDDSVIEAARQTGVTTFVTAAAQARTRRNLGQAAAWLAIARQIEPDSAELKQEAAALASAQAASAEAAQSAEQNEGIEILKQQLTKQAANGDIAGAASTAAALRRVLAGSLYASSELPELLIQAYMRSARNQALSGRVDDALQTLADGRRKFGRSPELKNMEASYVTVGDVYDQLSTAIVLDVPQQRQYLQQLRVSTGDDFDDIERMLARTLANRIADERAAKRAPLAAKLLEAGHSVFPEYASLLGQGRAGVLPKTPLQVVQ